MMNTDVFNKGSEGDNAEDEQRTIPFLKGYTVFNAEQFDGLPSHYYQLAQPKRAPREDHPAYIESWLKCFRTTSA